MQKKIVLFLFLASIPFLVFAQFEGGSYDGYAKGEGETEVFDQYTGGNYDGYAKGEGETEVFDQYTGGSYDGYAKGEGETEVFDQYTGGSSDGYAKGETAEGGSTLPVVLSVFTAQLIENTPILNWVTQTETNNAGWNIFRSENDSLEQSLQINPVLIPGAGTCTQPTEYTFEDELPVQADSTYLYLLESVDISGISKTYGPISLTIPEGEDNPNSPEIPKIYGLYQNFPNPFNPETEIGFALKEDTRVYLIIYNLKGQKVITLLNNKFIEKDRVTRVIWYSKDANGKKVSSGIYFYELRTNNKNYQKKMLLLK